MSSKIHSFLPLGLILLGVALLFTGSRRPVTLLVDGIPQTVLTRALTPAGVVRSAGLPLQSGDRLIPARGALLGWRAAVRLERARAVTLWQSPAGQLARFDSSERIPANLLAHAGLKLYPGDRLRWNGLEIDPAQGLPPAAAYILQVLPGQAVTLSGSQSGSFHSSAATLGAALWQAGLRLTAGDRLSAPFLGALQLPAAVDLRRAVPLTIQIGEQTVNARSSAATVGAALTEAGLALQEQDYAQPAENAPLPLDGVIKVVRVREEVLLEQKPVAFKTETTFDPETELDQQRVIEPGQYGVEVTRVRVRYENGKEITRQEEAHWTASQPKNKKIGYGTKVVIRTLDTPDGPIQYWRAIQVYATSYSPCRSAADKCYYGTPLGLPVKRGVVGVSARAYPLVAGSAIYVPGYGRGIIADLGAGVPGKFLVDLGFSDDDYEPWHQDTTLYFLTPVPANIPYILPY